MSADLRAQGDAYRAAALLSTGAQSIVSYKRSRDCYLESLQLLASRQESAPAPDSAIAATAMLTNYIAETTEHLAEARKQGFVAGQSLSEPRA